MKKALLVSLAAVVVAFLGLISLNVFFDEPLSPDVKKALAQDDPRTPECLASWHTMLGYGSPDPLAKGKELMEAMKSLGTFPTQRELENLGFRAHWFPKEPETLTEEEFRAIEGIFSRGSMCRPSRLVALFPVSSTGSLLKSVGAYNREVLERSEKEGPTWFWEKTTKQIETYRSFAIFGTTMIETRMAITALVKIKTFLREDVSRRPKLIAAKPEAIDELLNLSQQFEVVARGAALMELQLADIFLKSPVEFDPTGGFPAWFQYKFLYRPNETVNTYWRTSSRGIAGCLGEAKECPVVQPKDLPDASEEWNFINPFGKKMLQIFGLTPWAFGSLRKKMTEI